MKRFVLLLSLFCPALLGASQAVPAHASLIAELSGFTPGQSITVALDLVADPGWHTYWKDPGDAGLPTSFDLSLPQGITSGGVLWPKPQVFHDAGGLTGYGYMGEAILPFVLQIPSSYKAESLKLGAKVSWLVCKDICIPGSADLSLTIVKGSGPGPDAARIAKVRPSLGKDPEGYKGSEAPEGAAMATPSSVATASPAAGQAAPAGAAAPGMLGAGANAGAAPDNLGLMLLFAFLGGLILNLMPCVLPVLSLKVLSFVRQGAEDPRRSLLLSVAFSAGIVLSFWALAGAVIAARAAGTALGWGFQFQSPGFVIAMAVLVSLFALNLFGVFEFSLPGGTANILGEAERKEGLLGAFFMGAFMTVLATPCTAPFLGTALGFAFSQGNGSLFLIFTASALGLALPYQVLTSFPKLMGLLPKPGAWMLYFKQLMAFPLLGTLCWLLMVLGKESSMEAVIWTLAFLIALALIGWIYGTFATRAQGAKAFGILLLELLILGGAYQGLLRKAFDAPLQVSAAGDGTWIPYDAQKIQSLEKEGKSVFVDFTAEWCWTCKVNERVALENADVKEAFEKSGIVRMKADWTRADPAVSAALKAFGRSGVPFYAFYSPRLAEPLTLAEVLRPSDVIGAIQKVELPSGPQ